MNRGGLILAAVLAGGCVHASYARGPFLLVNAIPLPGVSGRIDHLAVDLAGSRLFVAALGNNSVEVLDLRTRAVVNSITGLSEPRGVAFLPDRQKLYISNGGTETCNVYDGRTLAFRTAIDMGSDADNIHYDAASSSLFVAAGSGLGVIDPANDAQAGYIRLAGHPEGFALSRGARRVYANVPASRKVVVVDAQARQVVAEWPAGPVSGNFFSNFPLALDEDHNRVFVRRGGKGADQNRRKDG